MTTPTATVSDTTETRETPTLLDGADSRDGQPDMRLIEAMTAVKDVLDVIVAESMTLDTTAYDARLAAMRAIPGGESEPAIVDAIRRMTAEHDAAIKNARTDAARDVRKRHADLFAQFAAYGVPPVIAPERPVKSGKSAAAVAQRFPDADGHLYVKRGEVSRRNGADVYVPTGSVQCGECALSEILGRAYSAPGNFRQSVTESLVKMTAEQIQSHTACFEAFRDAEFQRFPATVTVTFYDRVTDAA